MYANKAQSPFFETEDPIRVRDFQSLLDLNVSKPYFAPGDSVPKKSNEMPSTVTSGIFRGQPKNWALVPKAWRDLEKLRRSSDTNCDEARLMTLGLYKFTRFCEYAAQNNPDFPIDPVKQMGIAQHFGVPTPLLDWTRNVLVATYFAIGGAYRNSVFSDNQFVFVYHIRDERALYHCSYGDPLAVGLGVSQYFQAACADRRIERQQGVFSYHPSPLSCHKKIKVDTYAIDEHLARQIHSLLNGMGFTDHYYFPDYAGIAQMVNDELF
jgi:hypothetical protein